MHYGKSILILTITGYLSILLLNILSLHDNALGDRLGHGIGVDDGLQSHQECSIQWSLNSCRTEVDNEISVSIRS